MFLFRKGSIAVIVLALTASVGLAGEHKFTGGYELGVPVEGAYVDIVSLEAGADLNSHTPGITDGNGEFEVVTDMTGTVIGKAIKLRATYFSASTNKIWSGIRFHTIAGGSPHAVGVIINAGIHDVNHVHDLFGPL